MINTTSFDDGGGDAPAGDNEEWIQSSVAGIRHVIHETLNAINTGLEAVLTDSSKRGATSRIRDDVRQLRGAFLILGFGKGARLLMEAERIARSLPGRADAKETCRLLLRALHELKAYLEPLNDQLKPLADLDSVTEELRACRGVPRGQVLSLAAGDGRGAVAHGGDHAPVAGEWEIYRTRGADVQAMDAEHGMYVAQIKDRLKSVVQIMPQWWESLHEPRFPQALKESFQVIADRARALELAEVAKLALLLERLAAKIDHAMIPMAVQMMYGVIEQGVLKLGVLFLQYCRPHDPPRGEEERVKLANALADMQLLTNEVVSVDGERLFAGASPAAREPSPVHEHGGGSTAADGLDLGRLEDLLIEANLLHAQLQPRINLMKQQQRRIQSQLACLYHPQALESVLGLDSDAGVRDKDRVLSEKITAMVNANRLLARLIGECEDCLLKYRRATHDLQRVVCGGSEYPVAGAESRAPS